MNYEIAGHHIDDDVAKHEGFPAAFAMAPLTFSYLQTAVRDWIGNDGWVESADIRLRSPFYRNRTLTVGGTVTAIDDSECLITVELSATDDLGTLVATGRAALRLTANP